MKVARPILLLALLLIGLPIFGAAVAGNRPVAQAVSLDAISEKADLNYAKEIQQDPDLQTRVWQEKFIQKSWEWHLLSTQIIFFVVLVVVGFGLVVSWLQFRSETSRKQKGDGEEGAAYDISASLQSVGIKSKTIGAVVLIFSGVFFFLYLSIVYPMTTLGTPDQSSVENRAEK